MKRYGKFEIRSNMRLGVIRAAIGEMVEALGADATVDTMQVETFRDVVAGENVFRLLIEAEDGK